MYPDILKNEEIFPIVGEELAKYKPLLIPLSGEEADIMFKNIRQDIEVLQRYVDSELKKAEAKWSISGYLGHRKWISKCFSSTKDNRNVHLGIDIGLAKGASIYAPIDGKVVISEIEDGPGNYGGLVVLEHNINNNIFYSLYGHIDTENLPEIGKDIKKGENFAFVGDYKIFENGFSHTHLQILTKEAFDNGWVSLGYCAEKDTKKAEKLCPNPIHLINYKQ